MSRFPIHTIDTAPSGSRAALQGLRVGQEVGMRARLVRCAAAVATAALIAGAFCLPAAAQNPDRAGAKSPTLYQRLGGYDRIAAFVDTAFPRVAKHPELVHLFRGHSMDSNVRQRQLIIDRLCHDTGGPCAYTGRPLPTVHENLRITAAQWEAFMKIIDGAAQELSFGDPDRREFLELFRSRYRGETVDR
jgi:hemoglobin